MTAKQYLRSIRRIDKRIDALNENINRLWAQATATTQQISGEGGGRNSEVTRKPEVYAERVADLTEQRDHLIRQKAEAMDLINRIEQHNYAALLLQYYLLGRTWEETADAIGYSYLHTVHRLHPAALAAMQDVIDCNN